MKTKTNVKAGAGNSSNLSMEGIPVMRKGKTPAQIPGFGTFYPGSTWRP